MARNNFDESEAWGDSSPQAIWEDEETSVFEGGKRSLNLKFRLNPKIAGVATAGVIGAITLFSILNGSSGTEVATVETPKAVLASKSPIAATTDLYSQPKMLQSFIDNALASAATIFCGNYSGSGWSIDLSDDPSTSLDDALSTEIITNHHVIEGCENGGVTFKPMGTQDTYDAYVYSYDIENDIAILMTDKYLPPLPTVSSDNEPRVGNWVMAVGSPGDGVGTLEGSITYGNITNFSGKSIITDTTINPGNSGGPLMNSAGQVIAIVTAKIVDERIDSIGYAKKVRTLCEQIGGCTEKMLLK